MNIIVRADASAQIGTGHVMRCLALSQTWRVLGGQAIFMLANKSPSLEARLRFEGMEVVYLSGEAGSNEDAQQTLDLCQQFSAQWIILDGYHFGAAYQKAIKNFDVSLLFFDDNGHADHYYADLILNQNISAKIDLYQSREPYTQLLLGTQYVLLRKEFLSWKNWQRVINPIASKILVTLGGSDPDNVTLKVIQALQIVKSNNLEVIVVVGGSNPHYEKLQAEVAKSRTLITLQRNVSNMPELMAWADIAIAAGGSTNWELAFMGLPSLVITVADNQKESIAELDRQGVITNLGWHQDLSIEWISFTLQKLICDRLNQKKMSQQGQQIVDGEGVMRIVSKIADMIA
ncbi:UDP-2,4-diacetamido-2,4,6-trideoxy-beta-L-altropyranose hydrolase [Pseudanabaena sp. BC1403]|uniref:UDP-2,4-diacetamido-2,4, 6-trideoxy-beta-L-altropyranose hydrolase n=1 Tax=Pseudanabaena sp. BC1403 TaxID=2043171 RepID=UPI000CD7F87E|nr:UDP-2,4-diacetamido-2,4,6-trideoxy-beta-L-altropyranose hydrolase [Pseudanabaena sp. BC1403]